MQRQSLSNLPNPYNVSVHPGSGLYLFNTEQQITYACGFNDVTGRLSPVLGIYDIRIFDFDFTPFDPSPESPKQQDKRISETIADLLTKFFAAEDIRVLTFVCDSSDGRGRERQILFRQWHKSVRDMIDLNPLEITVESDMSKAYGGVLTRKDFPHKDVLQTELIDNVRGIILEKYGR